MLPKRMFPRTEQTFQATLGARTIQLNARPDLALGRPAGPDARSLLIDLKTRSAETYPVLRDVLSRYADMITTYRPDGTDERAVTVLEKLANC